MAFLDDLLKIKGSTSIWTYGDDASRLEDFVELVLKSAFSKVSKGEIKQALEMTNKSLDADKLVEAAKLQDSYGFKQKKELEKGLAEVLSRLKDASFEKAPAAATPRPPVALTPGGGMKGFDFGSIGGFLANSKGEIFFFTDAHVVVSVLTKTRDAKTASSDKKDPVSSVSGAPIGEVVCNCAIRTGAVPSYDIALVKLNDDVCRCVTLQYQGKTPESVEKSFRVSAIDTKLQVGKQVFLFGNSSGMKEGKLKTVEPTTYEKAPYDRAKSDPKEEISLHDVISVELAHKGASYSLSVQGDSGGLWVSADGAVGMQLLGGVGTAVAWIHPMSTVLGYFHKSYDSTLRFATDKDLERYRTSDS